MTIFTIGMNHKTATLDLREKVFFATDRLALYLQDLMNHGAVREAVLLSTCNRTELYCDADDLAAVLDWFFRGTSVPRAELERALYVYEAEEAVAHMMAVACGLDSMVLGESQILGQMKVAFSESVAVGAIGVDGTMFHRLFQHIFAVAKEIRTTTRIGACPVSVASAAIYFAKAKYADFANANIALIGAGETGELMLRYLNQHATPPIHVINRSLEKAHRLAKAYTAIAHGFDDLLALLTEVDMLFSATGSVTPMITTSMMQAVMAKRGQRPLLLIDMAVPRDIEAEVATIPAVRLYCIDDLKTMIEQHRQGREHGAEQARALIRQKSAAFIEERAALDKAAATIRAYRQTIEELAQAELAKARQQLQQGMQPDAALEYFVRAFTNKLLHEPSVQLRQAGVEGRFELLHLAKQLFAIPEAI